MELNIEKRDEAEMDDLKIASGKVQEHKGCRV
jgi:hypothetical protein